MIDLHCHILPGIDDGAFDLADSLAMGRVAAGDGIETIAATPTSGTTTTCGSPSCRSGSLR